MNNKNKIYIISLISFFLLSGLILYTHLYNHEQTHKLIAYKYGCNSSIMKTTLFKQSYFKCLNYQYRDPVEKQLQMENEIQGYNTYEILIGILGSLFILINIYFNKNNEVKTK